MNCRFRRDTNIVIALFAVDTGVIEKLENAEQVFIPSVVIGEFYYEAQKSSRQKENITRIDDFADENTVFRIAS